MRGLQGQCGLGGAGGRARGCVWGMLPAAVGAWGWVGRVVQQPRLAGREGVPWVSSAAADGGGVEGLGLLGSLREVHSREIEARTWWRSELCEALAWGKHFAGGSPLGSQNVRMGPWKRQAEGWGWLCHLHDSLVICKVLETRNRRDSKRSLLYLGLGKAGPASWGERMRQSQASWRPCSRSRGRILGCCLGCLGMGWLTGCELQERHRL